MADLEKLRLEARNIMDKSVTDGKRTCDVMWNKPEGIRKYTLDNVLFSIMNSHDLYLYSRYSKIYISGKYDPENPESLWMFSNGVVLSEDDKKVLQYTEITNADIIKIIETVRGFNNLYGKQDYHHNMQLFIYDCRICGEIFYGLSPDILKRHKTARHADISWYLLRESYNKAHLPDYMYRKYVNENNTCVICNAVYMPSQEKLSLSEVMDHMLSVHTNKEYYSWLIKKIEKKRKLAILRFKLTDEVRAEREFTKKITRNKYSEESKVMEIVNAKIKLAKKQMKKEEHAIRAAKLRE